MNIYAYMFVYELTMRLEKTKTIPCHAHMAEMMRNETLIVDLFFHDVTQGIEYKLKTK